MIELLREHFGLPPTTERRDALARLRGSRRLIVLDNAESVPHDDPRRRDYVRLVNDLRSTEAQILLTSRVEWDDIELCRAYTPKTLTPEAAQKIVVDMARVWDVQHDVSGLAGEIAAAARLHPRLIEWGIRQMKRFPPEKVIRDLKELKSRAAQEALDEMINKTLREMIADNGEMPAHILKRLNVCRGGSPTRRRKRF